MARELKAMAKKEEGLGVCEEHECELEVHCSKCKAVYCEVCEYGY